jgi:hypothetical protein
MSANIYTRSQSNGLSLAIHIDGLENKFGTRSVARSRAVASGAGRNTPISNPSSINNNVIP